MKVGFQNISFGAALVQLFRNTAVAENEGRFFSKVTGWDSKFGLAMRHLWY